MFDELISQGFGLVNFNFFAFKDQSGHCNFFIYDAGKKGIVHLYKGRKAFLKNSTESALSF